MQTQRISDVKAIQTLLFILANLEYKYNLRNLFDVLKITTFDVSYVLVAGPFIPLILLFFK